MPDATPLARPTAPPARPLVVRCGAFGDVVMLTTMIRLVAARHGQPVDVVGSGAWTPALLEPLPEVGDIRLLTSRKTPYLLCPSQWALVRWLRARPRGPVYLCDREREIRALLARGGVHAEDLVERNTVEPPGQPVRMLWPDRWLRMGRVDPVAWQGTAVDALRYRKPVLVVRDGDRDDLARWRADRGYDGPLVLFQPGNKRTHKRGTVATRQHPKYWPPAHWAAVVAAIQAGRPDARVLLCGSEPEHGVLEEIRVACAHPSRVHNLAGDLPIPRLLALLEVASGMVSVDTGPAHAAAALGCPLVVLFGSASPELWRPTGDGPIVLLGGDRGDAGRVADIEPEAVVHAFRDSVCWPSPGAQSVDGGRDAGPQ